MISPKPPTPRNLPPPTEFYTPPQLSSSLPLTPELPLNRDPSTPITRPNFRDPRPISVPYAGKRESFDARGLIRREDSPRIKVGEKVVLGDENCWGCEKRVYAAEQVRSVGAEICLHKLTDRYSQLVTSEHTYLLGRAVGS
jgi:hypothetical protein